MKRIISVVVVVALYTGCQTLHFDDAIETACIKGRISAKQADAINDAGHKQREPGYCLGQSYTDDAGTIRQGNAWCQAEEGDRILAGSCSEMLKTLRTGD